MSSEGSVRSSSSSRPKKYICDFELAGKICGKAYNRPSLLQQHQRSHTQERPFVCVIPDCDKSFLRNSHLQAHLLSHKVTDDKPFQCSVCGKGINTKQHLKRHEITHTKSFTCTFPSCEESFYRHQQLRHHILSVHEKTLNCKLCGKNFSRPYRLAQHQQKYHSSAPAYQCDFVGCFKNFKNWSALQLHIRTDHPKLTCKVCGKGCVGKQGLRSHMIIHDESKVLKLWDCNYCSENFTKKLDLINHYNDVHDGNVPEDLLKPNEKEKLDALLNDSDDHGLSFLAHVSRNGESEDSEDSETDDAISGNIERTKNLKRARSIASLASTLTHTSVMDLIASNVSSRKIACTYKKCDRLFARDHDLMRHVEWHKKQLVKVEEFLSSLEKNDIQVVSKNEPITPDSLSIEQNDDVDSEYDSDEELNRMVDEELELLNEGIY